MRHVLSGLFIILYCNNLFAQYKAKDFQVYVLKKGDTISELLYAKGFKPLYLQKAWMKETLAVNHLDLEQAKKIKEGFPIILPTKVGNVKVEHKYITKIITVEDKVSAKQSSIMQKGLLANSLSEHQKVNFTLAHYQKLATVRSKDVKQLDNVFASFEVVGKNDYTLGELDFNPAARVDFWSQGALEIQDNQNKASNFAPGAAFTIDMAIKEPGSLFEFGPTFSFEKQSTVDFQENDFVIRRDEYLWSGFFMQKSIETNLLDIFLKAQLDFTLNSNNFNGYKDLNSTRLRTLARISLTQDYLLGAFMNRQNYSNSRQNDALEGGLTLTYVFDRDK